MVKNSSDEQAMADRFGSARQIDKIPKDLQVINRRGSLFKIALRSQMTVERFQELLNQVTFK